MARHKNIYIYFLLASLINIGCKKKLDLNPLDKISDASYWKTSNDFQLFANDFYNGLQGAHNYTENNSDIAFGTGTDAATVLKTGVRAMGLTCQDQLPLYGIILINISAPPITCYKKHRNQASAHK